MQRIRINKDITVRWRVKTNGVASSLIGRDLSLVLTDSVGNTTAVSSFVVNDTNRIVFVWRGRDQVSVGRYTLTLFENAGDDGATCLDAVDFVELVRRTDNEGGSAVEGLDTETVELEGDLIYSGRGLSAYEVWLAAGNTGTVSDYLASLTGPAGPNRVSTITVSDITGLLKGSGGKVAQAQEGIDYQAPISDLSTIRSNAAFGAKKTYCTEDQYEAWKAAGTLQSDMEYNIYAEE